MTQEEIKQFVAARLNQGMSLSDVQKALGEAGVSIKYLELRMLAAELEVDWKKQDAKKQAAAAKPQAAPAAAELLDEDDDAPEAEDGLDGMPGAGGGRTEVTVSKLVRPGAAMSGEVKFGSGAKAEWYVDAYGRLGLQPAPGSSRPTENDIQEFQIELHRKLGGGR